MDAIHFLMLLLLLASLSLGIGLYAARHVHNQADYYLAGRQVTTIPLMLTLVATHLGGGLILGTADQAYQAGVYALAYVLGLVLAFGLLATGFASKLRGFNIVTTAQLFETHYQSRLLRKIASLLIVLAMWGILVGQVVATRKFISGLGIDMEWVFLLFWGFVIVYTVIGGLRAVILTDIYQVLFIILLFTLIFIFTVFNYPFASLPWRPEQTFDTQQVSFLSLLLLPLLFCIVEQDLAQRCFAAKTRKVATIAALLSAITILLFGFIPVYFGVLANYLHIPSSGDAAALVTLINTITTMPVMILVTIGLLTAIISTSDSLLCAISSNLAQDFGIRLMGKHALNFARITTLACGILALFMSYYFDNILAVFMKSIELPISALFVSIFFCCLKKRVYKAAAYLSVFTGIAAFIILKPINIAFPKEIIQILLSLLAYVIGWFWAKLTPDKIH